MKISGIIEELNQLIVSDPMYDNDVKCRYKRTNLNKKNWKIQIEVMDLSDFVIVPSYCLGEGLELNILISNPEKKYHQLLEGDVYEESNEITEQIIGVDTASICIGINDFVDLEKTKQLTKSLNTFSDGKFGYVREGKTENELDFIWISGTFDVETNYSVKDIIQYLQEQFKVTKLCKEVDYEEIPVKDDDINNLEYDI